VFSATSTGSNPNANALSEQLTTDNNINILFIPIIQIQYPESLCFTAPYGRKLCHGFDAAKVAKQFWMTDTLSVKREKEACFSVGTGRDLSLRIACFPIYNAPPGCFGRRICVFFFLLLLARVANLR
jgi:hypothetical protein